MKKMICALLALTMCFGLCACGGSKVDLPPVPTAEATAEPTAPVESEPTAAPTPEVTPAAELSAPVIVTVEHTDLEAYDPQYGETLILSFSYDSPRMFCESAPEAADAVNEHLALMDDAFYTGEDYGEGYGTGYNDMLTLAEENYGFLIESQIESPTFELSADRTAEVLRNDGRVLTIRFTDYYYTGGAHGNTNWQCCNYDARTGALLKLDDLAADASGFRAFLLARMLELAENDEYIAMQIDGFVDPADLENTLAALLRDGSWYLDEQGLTVFSDLYEISSYAAGSVHFDVPYADLEAWLKPEFMPEEKNGTAAFRILTAADMTDSGVEILDMVKTADEGETYYLVSDGKAENVQITGVEYAYSYFYETGLHWACSSVDNAAVQLVTLLPEGMPNLRLSYSDAEGAHVFYLSESGENGAPVLVDDSIEAVG